jgi:hypothetical protein
MVPILLIFVVLMKQTHLSFSETISITRNTPRVVLNTNEDGSGLSFKSVAKNYPDLSEVGFDNKAVSACVLGTYVIIFIDYENLAQCTYFIDPQFSFSRWIFYGSKLYSNFSEGVTVQFSKSNGCFKLKNLQQKISSLRFAGSSTDFQYDFIDLFSGSFYTGVHLRSNADVKNISSYGLQTTNSAIVSGSSEWTLYEDLYYSGAFKCIGPRDQQVPKFYRNPSDLGNLQVRSFRKGCQPPKLITRY